MVNHTFWAASARALRNREIDFKLFVLSEHVIPWNLGLFEQDQQFVLIRTP
jgi:hypothetical protein